MLNWFKKPNVVVDHAGGDISVTLPGTSFSVVYVKTEHNKLVASKFSGSKGQAEKGKISFTEFLALAWTAANVKAKELGWIA